MRVLALIRISCWPFKTNDTVDCDTPATRATSFMVTRVAGARSGPAWIPMVDAPLKFVDLLPIILLKILVKLGRGFSGEYWFGD